MAAWPKAPDAAWQAANDTSVLPPTEARPTALQFEAISETWDKRDTKNEKPRHDENEHRRSAREKKLRELRQKNPERTKTREATTGRPSFLRTLTYTGQLSMDNVIPTILSQYPCPEE